MKKLKMNCKIAIFGDSWACGVWDNIKDEYRISHLGINHFLFANNYHATNFARPGSCNSENINTLEKYHNDFDIKIFIVTEPFRDFYHNNAQYNNNKTFKHNCESLIDRQLNKLQLLCGSSTMIVGGLHIVNTDYEFFHCVNWCKLIRPNISWPKYYADPGQLGQKLKRNEIVIPDLVDTAYDQEAYDKYFKHLAKDKKHFWPDGRHPNELGHKILFEDLHARITS